MVEIGSSEATEILSDFGQVGLSAEKVASVAARDAREYLVFSRSGRRASDEQLLLPLALAGAGFFFAEKTNMQAQR